MSSSPTPNPRHPGRPTLRVPRGLLPILVALTLGHGILPAADKTPTGTTLGLPISEEGFRSLTNGKDLTGWKNPFSWGKAEVVGEEIHLTADRKFFLVTDRTYGDFVFEGEVFLPPGDSNSGFMFRAQVAPGRVWGYQAEVDGDEQRKWSGGLYDEGRRQWFINPIRGDAASEASFRKRAGEAFKRHDWNRYRITCEGKRLRIEVNGVVTTDVEDGQDARGVIALQHHGEAGKVYRFRNLRILELDH